MAVENGFHLRRLMVEVAGELDLFVAQGCDLGECAFKIFFQLPSNRVELHANSFQTVIAGERAQTMQQDSSRD